MKIAIVSGSHRPGGESNRVARHLAENISKTIPGAEAQVILLSEAQLPMWDEGAWMGAQVWKDKWGPLAAQLQQADGLVIISPEWAGMVPPAVKNFLLLCSPQEVGHKPALLVGVTSGATSGSYPIAELRSSGYKNNRIAYMPEHVIVRDVANMFKGDGKDAYIVGRLHNAMQLLGTYAKAFREIRAANVWNYKDYTYGM